MPAAIFSRMCCSHFVDRACSFTSSVQLAIPNLSLMPRESPYLRFASSCSVDGSVILNTKMRYGLVLGFKFNQGEFHTPEEIRLVSVRFDTVKAINDGMFRAGVGFHTGINFWNVRCFDGITYAYQNGIPILNRIFLNMICSRFLLSSSISVR